MQTLNGGANMFARFDQIPLLAEWATGLMSDLDPNKRFALVVVVIGCVTGVICTAVLFISSSVVSIHRRRTEIEIKREMIERGMSADEITKIIEAVSPPEDATQRWIASWAKCKKSS
jgi:predicted RNA methylase